MSRNAKGTMTARNARERLGMLTVVVVLTLPACGDSAATSRSTVSAGVQAQVTERIKALYDDLVARSVCVTGEVVGNRRVSARGKTGTYDAMLCGRSVTITEFVDADHMDAFIQGRRSQCKFDSTTPDEDYLFAFSSLAFVEGQRSEMVAVASALNWPTTPYC
jgi:hypothetical protein